MFRAKRDRPRVVPIAGALAGILSVALVLSCSPATPPPPATARQAIDPHMVDGRRALAEVQAFIALGPREAGSDGARGAAEHLQSKLLALGLEARIDEFTAETPHGPLAFRNVLAVAPGTRAETVVLLSHFDTKAGISPSFAGANDSGSSTGLLLELARVLKLHEPLPLKIILAFVDGEECRRQYGPTDGLHGSRRLAGLLRHNAEPVRGVIVLDMIGDRNLSVTIPRNMSPQLGQAVLEAAAREGARERFSLASGPVIDDHVPFLEAGFPAVDIIDFEYGSAPGRNDYWHTPQDTFDKLSAQSLETVGRVVIRVLNAIARDPNAVVLPRRRR